MRRRSIFAATLVLALLPQAGLAQPCNPSAEGLVAWYPADGNANDEAAGNDGTLENGATYGQGRSGQAFQLDGIDDFVSAPASEATDPLFAGTLSAWVNVDVRPSEAGHAMTVIGRGGDGQDFDLQIGEDNLFSFSVGDAVRAGSSRIVKPGTWYHLAATWNSVEGLRFYVGGIQEGTNAELVEREAGGEPLRIGDHPFSGPTRLQGRIDDVRIYDRALDEEEVAELACVFPGICGDANNDATVNSSDALRILRAAVGQDVDCPTVRCDVNDDGDVIASDSLRTLRYGVGQDLELTCPAAM